MHQVGFHFFYSNPNTRQTLQKTCWGNQESYSESAHREKLALEVLICHAWVTNWLPIFPSRTVGNIMLQCRHTRDIHLLYSTVEVGGTHIAVVKGGWGAPFYILLFFSIFIGNQSVCRSAWPNPAEEISVHISCPPKVLCPGKSQILTLFMLDSPGRYPVPLVLQ